MLRIKNASIIICLGTGIFMTLLAGCGERSWNNPYSAADEGKNILYSSFTERPKHLDPAQSYSSNEVAFTGQIYEPPLQYHYLKRPYTLIPLTAEKVPEPVYLDRQGKVLPDDVAIDEIAFSVYDITIRPGIRYQPHPAFARNQQGDFLYHRLTEQQLASIYALEDFAETGTRELVAADYVYQIKRLAHPRLHSPIFGLMAEYIIGLRDYAKTLAQAVNNNPDAHYLDLTKYALEGAQVIDRYTYRITLHGKYPQLRYWLTMPFFAPIPSEVDRFYSQPGLEEKNISLDWYPVGTGPYMLSVNNPNLKMVLERNPNFIGESYPHSGEEGDEAAGLLRDAGKTLPFIDKAVYSLEKESIPYWNKFLQGYYDTSGISSDSFDQAITISSQGEPSLTDEMQDKGIRLLTAIAPSTYYTGFNMQDPVIGGYSERARKLRQAISIAADYEEYISIFLNGRGIAAQGPLPPGIFGYIDGVAGINRYVYDVVNGRPKRKSIDEAKKLLADAGYPNGKHAQTGEPLLLHLDTAASGPDAKARFDWWRKQFRKLNIQLVIRSTDYNRFQDKMLNGTAQIFQWGWNADYPDPENFMFLLYGPNMKAGKNGENAANYNSPEFDRLFEKMKNMDSTPQRQSVINEMIDTARKDAPWLWGLHPKAFSLQHAWYHNSKPGPMINNGLKFKRIDPELRSRMRDAWNEPNTKPLYIILVLAFIVIMPGVVFYLRREKRTALAT